MTTTVNESTTASTAEDLEGLIRALAARSLAASHVLSTLETEIKNHVLETLADLIEESADTLIAENRKDLEKGRDAGLTEALLDRLAFTPERIRGMAEGARQVAALPDPVGEEIERTVRPNGIDIRKIRVPIGVVGIIYESRPNVTVDCAILCFKSGNACILRGGKEAFHSNTALARLITKAMEAHAEQ